MADTAKTRIGLERLADLPSLAKDWGRCGLLCNQASTTIDYQPSWAVLQQILGPRLVSLFGPQHGLEATAQDNMIETSHSRHTKSGLPVYSLYSETREPTEEMIEGLDTLIVDIQIVGCRVYTFKSTIAGFLRAAKRSDKRVVVLDRPNPTGGRYVEGRSLDADTKSFVGQFVMPMRHGLSAGEAALFFNAEIGARLEVIKMEGWDASRTWEATGRPWIITSPNLPTLDSVHVYPGTVIFEGTNVSEGRGTSLPFQFIGAPYIKDPYAFVDRTTALLGGPPPGVHLRPASFEPTFHKGAGKVCQGLQIHVLDPNKVESFSLALAILRSSIELGGDDFQWKAPPYEYDYETLPMKLIMGSRQSDVKFQSRDFDVRDPFWHEGIESYVETVQRFLLYARELIPRR